MTIDLNTADEYDASAVGLNWHGDGWTRLDDDARAGGPTVSADLIEPTVIADLTNGVVPSSASPTATPTGDADGQAPSVSR